MRQLISGNGVGSVDRCHIVLDTDAKFSRLDLEPAVLVESGRRSPGDATAERHRRDPFFQSLHFYKWGNRPKERKSLA